MGKQSSIHLIRNFIEIDGLSDRYYVIILFSSNRNEIGERQGKPNFFENVGGELRVVTCYSPILIVSFKEGIYLNHT